MDQKKRTPEEQLAEDLEIVELYEKLDLTFDPMSVLTANTAGFADDNCNNKQCC